MTPLVVSVPESRDLDVFDGLEVEAVVWNLEGEAPREDIGMVVLPRRVAASAVANVRGCVPRLIQHTSIGYDGFVPPASDTTMVANSASVYEETTAENALASILAAQRGIPRVLENQRRATWESFCTPGLLDRTVLAIGVGGVGMALVKRLEACGAKVTKVGTHRRDDVHGIDELETLLPQADIVTVVVPLTEATEGLIDARFLALMNDGALLVNFARGKVAATDAILAEAGRLRFCLDVTDPEPLPDGHPLFSMPDTIITAHNSGWTEAEAPRERALWRRQAVHLLAGEEPENLIWPR